MERPPRLRIVGLGERLGDVVQHGRPAQPEVVALRGHVVEHFERMVEIILVGVSADPLDPFEGLHFGEDQRQQPRPFEQVEAAGGHRRRDDLVQLDGDALARDDADALAVAPDRGEGFGQDVETELRGEAHGPHHAQRIVRKGDVGVARRADDPLAQIAQPLERIDQLAEGVAVERPRQRVDREIAAELVVFERPLLHGGLARIGRIGLLTCADELDFHTSGAQHRRTEGLEDRQTRMQFGGQRFGHGDPAPHDHHVDVRRRTPQIIVAHVTAHHVGAHAHRIRKARDAAENRIGKRIAAVVAHRCRQRL